MRLCCPPVKLIIRASLVIRHSDFVIYFAWLPTGNFAIAGVDFQIAKPGRRKNMLHLIWYIFVGFIVGCVAKALVRRASIHRLGAGRAIGSIVGGAVTPSVLSAKCRRANFISEVRFVSIVGAITSFVRLAQAQSSALAGTDDQRDNCFRLLGLSCVMAPDRRTFLGAPALVAFRPKKCQSLRKLSAGLARFNGRIMDRARSALMSRENPES